MERQLLLRQVSELKQAQLRTSEDDLLGKTALNLRNHDKNELWREAEREHMSLNLELCARGHKKRAEQQSELVVTRRDPLTAEEQHLEEQANLERMDKHKANLGTAGD